MFGSTFVKALNFVAAMQRVILSTRTQRKIKKPCKNFRVSLFTKYLKYLFFKQCRIRNILNYYAFIDYFIGYHPLFFKYGTPITAFTPFLNRHKGWFTSTQKVRMKSRNRSRYFNAASWDNFRSSFRYATTSESLSTTLVETIIGRAIICMLDGLLR